MNQGPAWNPKTTSAHRQLITLTLINNLTPPAAAVTFRPHFRPRLFNIQPCLRSGLVGLHLGFSPQSTLRTTVRVFTAAASAARPSAKAWPTRSRHLHGPIRFSRPWTSLTNTNTATAPTDGPTCDISCSSGRNDINSTATSNRPKYDAYWPLPDGANTLAPTPLLSDFAIPALGGDSGDISGARTGPFDFVPPAIAAWPPPAMQQEPQQQQHQAGDQQQLSPLPSMPAGLSPPGAEAAALACSGDPFSQDLNEVAAAAAAAAGLNVAVAADGKGAPAVDVTKHNFEVMLPVVRSYLSACDFFAFDCEMTGLFLEGQTENYLDDMQDRYSRTAAAAHSFIINQFGLSCFKRQEGAGPGGEKRYLAATFNFYLFPRPAEGAAASASSGASKRFLCDAGSLAFLASQGFDFNRCIYDGVPFVPVRQRDDLLRQLDRDNGGGSEPRGDVVLSKPEDLEFVTGLVATVRRWLDSPEAAAQLDLPPVNRYLRLLAYQALARPENFGGPPGGSPDWHPGFYVKKVQDERNFTCIRLVRCASAAEAQAAEAEDRRQRRAAVAAAAGFAAVWEAMRDSGRPAVGHNCMFDVAYGIAQFGEGRLPATWQGFKGIVARWFRGGLYDTKHICRQLPELLSADTSLGNMYGTLVAAQNGGGVPAGGAAAALSTATATAAAAGPLLPSRVSVSHARGFERYVAVAAGQLAHEAGYDAFMTGSVFAALEAVMEARNGATQNGAAAAPGAPAATSASPYASVVPYIWRLNVTRSDLPYALLRPVVPGDPSSVEPVPERPRVVYLGCLGQGVRSVDIHGVCEEAGLGKGRITFQPNNSALLELDTPEAAEAALAGTLAGRGLCAEVLSYADFRTHKDAMLAAGAWPLPGYGSNRTGGGAFGGFRGAGGAAGGFGAARGATGGSGAAAGASGGAVGTPGGGRGEAVGRPVKRPRVEPVEEEGVAPVGAPNRDASRCVVM